MLFSGLLERRNFRNITCLLCNIPSIYTRAETEFLVFPVFSYSMYFNVCVYAPVPLWGLCGGVRWSPWVTVEQQLSASHDGRIITLSSVFITSSSREVLLYTAVVARDSLPLELTDKLFYKTKHTFTRTALHSMHTLTTPQSRNGEPSCLFT